MSESSLDPMASAAVTNSVTRGYDDLDQRRFLFYAFALCAARTAAQQPLNLALARQQTCAAAAALPAWRVLCGVAAREGGLRALGRGMAAMTLGCALSEVVYLGAFEYGRAHPPALLGGSPAAAADAAAGYAADALCRCVHIPLSIVAYRQMTAAAAPPQRRLSTPQTLRAMWAENGVRSVFAGFGTTLVVGCQWTALWWALYGSLKSHLYDAAGPALRAARDREAQRQAGGPLSASSSVSARLRLWLLDPADNFLLNSVASVATSASTAVLFNPYLVVRTNLQVTARATLLGTTRRLWRQRGLAGFYGGLWLNVSASVIDGALASTSYEYAKLWADRSHNDASASCGQTAGAAAAAMTASVATETAGRDAVASPAAELSPSCPLFSDAPTSGRSSNSNGGLLGRLPGRRLALPTSQPTKESALAALHWQGDGFRFGGLMTPLETVLA